jgi:hypothetical protein
MATASFRITITQHTGRFHLPGPPYREIPYILSLKVRRVCTIQRSYSLAQFHPGSNSPFTSFEKKNKYRFSPHYIQQINNTLKSNNIEKGLKRNETF